MDRKTRRGAYSRHKIKPVRKVKRTGQVIRTVGEIVRYHSTAAHLGQETEALSMQTNPTGAALHRHEKRMTAVMALEALDPQDAATICAAVLEEISAGSPRLDTWGSIRSDAEFSADFANPLELEVYFTSALKRMRNQSLGLHARKRLFMAIWTSFSDADRKAFLASDYVCEVAA